LNVQHSTLNIQRPSPDSGFYFWSALDVGRWKLNVEKKPLPRVRPRR
jgi:hypothetical protein